MPIACELPGDDGPHPVDSAARRTTTPVGSGHRNTSVSPVSSVRQASRAAVRSRETRRHVAGVPSGEVLAGDALGVVELGAVGDDQGPAGLRDPPAGALERRAPARPAPRTRCAGRSPPRRRTGRRRGAARRPPPSPSPGTTERSPLPRYAVHPHSRCRSLGDENSTRIPPPVRDRWRSVLSVRISVARATNIRTEIDQPSWSRRWRTRLGLTGPWTPTGWANTLTRSSSSSQPTSTSSAPTGPRPAAASSAR